MANITHGNGVKKPSPKIKTRLQQKLKVNMSWPNFKIGIEYTHTRCIWWDGETTFMEGIQVEKKIELRKSKICRISKLAWIKISRFSS